MMAVYTIKNILDGKMYIGSSIDIERRKRQHLNSLLKNEHHSIHLQRAWNKYGKDNFVFEILDSNVTKENLREKEKEWILRCKTLDVEFGYNISESTVCCSLSGEKHPMYGIKFSDIGRTSFWKGKKIPKEICEKMRKPRSEAGKLNIKQNQPDRSGIKNSMYGKQFSKVHREKISHALQGKMSGSKNPMYGRIRGGENAGHKRKVVQISENGEYINEFVTIADAAESTKAVRQQISKCCSGKRKTTGGFRWEYADKYYSN